MREKIAKRHHRQHQQWLIGAGNWPWNISLGMPVEADLHNHQDNILSWISAWQSYRGEGDIIWCEKQWRTNGKQRLPEKLILHRAIDAAAWLGERQRFERAELRYQHFIAKWPLLSTILPRYFDILADYIDTDIDRLEHLLKWITLNPQSNLYPRQLPIPGLDSKWVERRKGIISDLIGALRGVQPNDTADFYHVTGLKKAPILMRIRILDKTLRAEIGHLKDISAPVTHLATLNLQVSHVYIVENLQTGLAFNDLPGSIVIVGLGYHVDILSKLPWLMQAKCFYWGDIDTHGFAILNRARTYLPHLESILMDEATLLRHKPLCVSEEKQHAATELTNLTSEEHHLYTLLKQQCLGMNMRLEQEKIDWEWSLTKISSLLT